MPCAFAWKLPCQLFFFWAWQAALKQTLIFVILYTWGERKHARKQICETPPGLHPGPSMLFWDTPSCIPLLRIAPDSPETKARLPEDQLSNKGVELNSWSQHWSSSVFNWVHPHFGAVETSLTNERPMPRHQYSCAMVCVPLWPMRVPLPGTFLRQCRKLRDSCSQWLCWICLEPTSLDADVPELCRPDTTP